METSLRKPLEFPVGQDFGQLQMGNQMAGTLREINMGQNMQCHSFSHLVYKGRLNRKLTTIIRMYAKCLKFFLNRASDILSELQSISFLAVSIEFST